VLVGFRRVVINQDTHPEQGRYFIIEINGRKIFAKGGNYVPADMIFARVDRARCEALIERALEANFNLLRVWGGGQYESTTSMISATSGHPRLAEFVFACGKYPATDEAFLRSVKQEATYNIRRSPRIPA